MIEIPFKKTNLSCDVITAVWIFVKRVKQIFTVNSINIFLDSVNSCADNDWEKIESKLK